MIDRHMSDLPATLRGLTGLRSTLGSFAVLGNHDISSDRYSYDRRFRGGVRIAQDWTPLVFVPCEMNLSISAQDRTGWR